MKIIEISMGKEVFVNDEDYINLIKWKWTAVEKGFNWYAKRAIKINGHYKTIYMHRQLLNPSTGFQVDHIDGNGLNNQRSNLRICTLQQNRFNQRKTRGNSKYKGVGKYINNKWFAKIVINKQVKYLGYFDTEKDAAIAYNIGAERYFGEFARLNTFPKDN